MKETLSLDYKDVITNPYNYGYETTSTGTIDPWIFSSLMARVGYIGNKYYFLSSQFAHIFTINNLKGVKVNFPAIKQPNDMIVPPLKAQG